MRVHIKVLSFTCVALFLLAFLMVGCKGKKGKVESSSSGRLKVCYIDSDELIGEFPDLINFMKKKERESLKIRTLLSSGKALTDQEKEKIKSTTIKFIKEENKQIENFVETVRKCTLQVAKEKKIDLVINNKSSDPIVEYIRGENPDITEDVRVKIEEMRKESKKEK